MIVVDYILFNFSEIEDSVFPGCKNFSRSGVVVIGPGEVELNPLGFVGEEFRVLDVVYLLVQLFLYLLATLLVVLKS